MSNVTKETFGAHFDAFMENIQHETLLSFVESMDFGDQVEIINVAPTGDILMNIDGPMGKFTTEVDIKRLIQNHVFMLT